MANLVVVCGPHAAGKMTVAESLRDEVWFENHLMIDNANLTPDQAADRVIEAFHLIPNEKDEKEYRFGV